MESDEEERALRRRRKGSDRERGRVVGKHQRRKAGNEERKEVGSIQCNNRQMNENDIVEYVEYLPYLKVSNA